MSLLSNRLILIVVFLYVSTVVYAQRKRKEDIDWSYELLHNFPNSSYVGGGIGIDIFLSGFNEGWLVPDFNAFWITPRFQVHLNGQMFAFESFNSLGSPQYDAFSVYELERSKNIQFTGTYFFINKVVEKDVGVTLSFAGMGRLGHYYLVQNVPSDVSIRFGIDAGVDHGFTFYKFEYGPEMAVDDQGQIENLRSNYPPLNYPSSVLDYTTLKVGVTYTRVENTEIDHATFGVCRSFNSFGIYGHLLYGVRQQLDNIYVRKLNTYTIGGQTVSDEYFREYEIQNNMQYQRLGFMIGVRHVGTEKFAASYHAQFGFYPGPKDSPINNMSLNLGIGIHIGKLYNLQ